MVRSPHFSAFCRCFDRHHTAAFRWPILSCCHTAPRAPDPKPETSWGKFVKASYGVHTHTYIYIYIYLMGTIYTHNIHIYIYSHCIRIRMHMHIDIIYFIYLFTYAQRLGFAPALQRRGFPFPIKCCCNFTLNREDQQRYYQGIFESDPRERLHSIGKINKDIREH